MSISSHLMACSIFKSVKMFWGLNKNRWWLKNKCTALQQTNNYQFPFITLAYVYRKLACVFDKISRRQSGQGICSAVLKVMFRIPKSEHAFCNLTTNSGLLVTWSKLPTIMDTTEHTRKQIYSDILWNIHRW